MIARAKQVFAVEIEGLEKTRDSLGASFVSAVRLILDTVSDGGIVVVSGVGKNLHVAEKMSAIFSSTGTRSIVLNPVQAMHGDLGMVSAKDVLVALSFSGESAEVNNLIPAIRRHGLKVISMTGRPDSTLAQMSDIHIEIPCGKEACPFGMAPTNSTTATMAMGDALAMVLIDAQKFPVEDYAMNHPAEPSGRRDRACARHEGDGRHAHGRAPREGRARGDGPGRADGDDEVAGRERGRRGCGREAARHLHRRRLQAAGEPGVG